VCQIHLVFQEFLPDIFEVYSMARVGRVRPLATPGSVEAWEGRFPPVHSRENRTSKHAVQPKIGPADRAPTRTVGGAKVVRSSPDDQVTLIGAGVTLHNCLAAANELKRDGISARVVDLYSVKPVDTQTLLDAAAATRDRMVVVEDHYPAGGIGSAVLEALNDAGHPVQVSHLAVRGLPGSGTPAELMRAAGISADRVVEAVRKVLAA
jgi:transketolase